MWVLARQFHWLKNVCKDFADISIIGIPEACYGITGTVFLPLSEALEIEDLIRYGLFPKFALGNFLFLFLFFCSLLNTLVASGSLLNTSISDSRDRWAGQLHFPWLQRILQQMVSCIRLSFCLLGVNNASCFARRLISFTLNVSQRPVLLVLLKIATPAEYIWMDEAASAPTERSFPQGMERLTYIPLNVSLFCLNTAFNSLTVQ